MGQVMLLDYSQMALPVCFTYCAAMGNLAFRDRVIAAMQSKALKKSELSRLSGVPYHTLDKWLKGVTDKTSAENATKIARALGIKVDGEEEADELRKLYFDVPEEKRQVLLDTIRALVRGMR
jgi:transcriptional regulator with XRE-family HTH domain